MTAQPIRPPKAPRDRRPKAKPQPHPQMANPNFWVWFDDTPVDEPIIARTRQSDMIAWDDHAVANPGEPLPGDGYPWRFFTFLAWRVLRREGGLEPGELVDAFAERVRSVTPITDPDDNPRAGSPTPPGVGPG